MGVQAAQNITVGLRLGWLNLVFESGKFEDGLRGRRPGSVARISSGKKFWRCEIIIQTAGQGVWKRRRVSATVPPG